MISLYDLLLIPFFICFFACIVGLLLHPPFFLYLLLACRSKKNNHSNTDFFSENQSLPLQVIQLPVYNEDLEMVKRLIDSACAVQYQREKLLIQLLDDSDKEAISHSLKEYITLKYSLEPELHLLYLHRKGRQNFKAGNLNYGLQEAKDFFIENGETEYENMIVSIFDADFIIPETFLVDTHQYFQDSSICSVQADMEYLNKNDNMLTRAAAVFQENLHRVDFKGRSDSNHLTTFKGSAGSWRYSAIRDCGFWQGDTQIEDVDLSFAAQAQGWKIIYTDRISCHSMLPSKYNDFKLQQRSWMKGLMEVMRKQLGSVIKSSALNVFQKVMTVDFFLIFSLQALFMIISHLTLIPAYLFWSSIAEPWVFHKLVLVLPLLLALTHIPFLAIKLGNNGVKKETVFSSETLFAFGLMTALFVTLSYGLIEGLIGVKVHRDRTEKASLNQKKKNITIAGATSIKTLKNINNIEWFMAVYSILLVGWAAFNGFFEIAIVYSVLALIYPVNAVISFLLLRKLSLT